MKIRADQADEMCISDISICSCWTCDGPIDREECNSDSWRRPDTRFQPTLSEPMSNASRRFVQAGEGIKETNAWTYNEWLCRPDLVPAEKLLMVRATMPSGHCHPFHLHPHREEIIHVVEGRAEQWVGDEYRILGPGEIAHLPAAQSPSILHGVIPSRIDAQGASPETSFGSSAAASSPSGKIAGERIAWKTSVSSKGL